MIYAGNLYIFGMPDNACPYGHWASSVYTCANTLSYKGNRGVA